MPVVALPCAKPSAAPWKPKSRVAGSLPVVVNWLWYGRVAVVDLAEHEEVVVADRLGVVEDRRARTTARTRMLTCLTVSMRKPSTPKSTQDL